MGLNVVHKRISIFFAILSIVAITCIGNCDECPTNCLWTLDNDIHVQCTNMDLTGIPVKQICHSAMNVTTVDISQNKISVLAISDPLFPCLQNVKSFRASVNQMYFIHSKYFQNWTALQAIILSYNELTYIDPQTFIWESLKHLTMIDLSHNLLTVCDMWPFKLPFYRANLHYKTSSTPIYINASYNKLETFRNTVQVQYYHISEHVELFLNLENNKLHSFKPLIDFIMETIDLSSLKQLLELNKGSVEIDFSKLTAFESLDTLRNTKVSFDENELHCNCDVYIIRLLWDKIAKGLFLNRYVYNMFTGTLCFTPERVKGKSFAALELTDFQCIRHICSDNDFCECIYTPGNQTLRVNCTNTFTKSLPNIFREADVDSIELYMPNNDITRLDDVPNASQLTILDISNNLVNSISEEFIWKIQKLQILLLNNNNLATLPFALKMMKSPSLVVLRLQGNPFACDCKMAWFKDWVMENKKILDPQGLTCRTPLWNSAKEVLSVPASDFICHRVNIKFIFLSIAVPIFSLVMFLLTTGIIAYVLRGYIRVILFSRFGWRFGYTYEDERKYDVFFSYNSSDEQWVENIVEHLEAHQPPFRVCLHYRDFEPGMPISENIVNTVDSTHCTAVVLSKGFATSDWCKYEFRVAHHNALHDKQSRILVILMEEIPNELLDNDLRTYLRTNTYLKSDDPRFWYRFLMSLPEPMQDEKKVAEPLDNRVKLNMKMGFGILGTVALILLVITSIAIPLVTRNTQQWQEQNTTLPVLLTEQGSTVTPTNASQLDIPIKNLTCDELGWVIRGNFCYFFNAEVFTTWIDAEYRCRRQGAHLVSIQDTDEHTWLLDYITSRLKVKRGTSFLWLGLTRRAQINASWFWTDCSQSNYTDWAYDQPSSDVDNTLGIMWITYQFTSYPRLGKWRSANPDIHQMNIGYVCKTPRDSFRVTPDSINGDITKTQKQYPTQEHQHSTENEEMTTLMESTVSSGVKSGSLSTGRQVGVAAAVISFILATLLILFFGSVRYRRMHKLLRPVNQKQAANDIELL